MADKIDPQKVVEWLNSHWEGLKLCPICHHNNWFVNDSLVQLTEFHRVGLVLGGPVIPMVVVSCNNCGHTLFFSALKLGVIAADAPAPKVSAPDAAEPAPPGVTK